MNELILIERAYLTEDSFGSYIPEDWMQIKRLFDAKLETLERYDADGNKDDTGAYVLREDVDALWEDVCNG